MRFHSACRWPDTRSNIKQECLRSISLQLHLFSKERDTREVSHKGNLPILRTDVLSSQHSYTASPKLKALCSSCHARRDHQRRKQKAEASLER